MEELQHNFSMMWSIDDLNTVLRLSNGDRQLAIGRILRHERTALPAEALIRSLLMSVDDNTPHNQRRLQQPESGGMAPPHTSDVQDATRFGRQPPPMHDEEIMAAHPLRPYGAAETRSRRPRTSHDNTEGALYRRLSSGM